MCFVVIKQRCCSRFLRCRDSQLSCENDGQHEDDQFDNTDCHKNKMHKKYTQINYKFVTLFMIIFYCQTWNPFPRFGLEKQLRRIRINSTFTFLKSFFLFFISAKRVSLYNVIELKLYIWLFFLACDRGRQSNHSQG